MLSYKGYMGKILRINLTTREIWEQEFDNEFCEKFLGGDGFAAKILYDEVKPGVDAFDPENRFIIMTGPVVGTAAPTAGRASIITKSPLTNGYMDCYYGGHFGAELKYAGYDGIVLEGKASSLIYLSVINGKVEIHDAEDLKGVETYSVQMDLRKRYDDPNLATMAIGPAGENLSRMACTIIGCRAAGRGGTGAVLGSKNVKAIVVRAEKPVDIKVPDVDKFKAWFKDIYATIKANPGTGQGLPTYGTCAGITVNNQLGILGTRNWQTEQFEGAEDITGSTMRKKTWIKDDACYACPIYCGKINKAKDGPYKGALTVGPEYETLWSLGSNVGNNNLESIIIADRRCDELGLDTVSVGSTISFAIECYEKGLLTKEDTGGIELKFGDPEIMLDLIEKIAKREGIGELLADGTMRAAEKIGQGAEKYAIHCKGLEIPAHSGRGIPGMAVGYATSVRGGTHQDGRPTAERVGVVDINQIEGKGVYEADVTRMTTILDSLIVCRMTEGILGLTGLTEKHAEIINVITGMNPTVKDVVDISDRIYAVQRAFNIRHRNGGRNEDILPHRFMNEPIPDGPAKGKYMPKETLDKLLDEYYDARGWDKETGYPTKETLVRLGLEDVVKDLY